MPTSAIYNKQTWANDEAGGTPLSASRLNTMESGIEAAGNGPFLVADATARQAISAPVTGQLVIQEDDLSEWIYDGSAWAINLRPWASYTPSNTNITVGNGTERAEFGRHRNTVHVNYELIWGSTTSFGGVIKVGLPLSVAGANAAIGASLYFDAAPAYHPGSAFANGGDSEVSLLHNGGGTGQVQATTPFTWTTNDVLRFSVTYFTDQADAAA